MIRPIAWLCFSAPPLDPRTCSDRDVDRAGYSLQRCAGGGPVVGMRATAPPQPQSPPYHRREEWRASADTTSGRILDCGHRKEMLWHVHALSSPLTAQWRLALAFTFQGSSYHELRHSYMVPTVCDLCTSVQAVAALMLQRTTAFNLLEEYTVYGCSKSTVVASNSRARQTLGIVSSIADIMFARANLPERIRFHPIRTKL